MKSYYATFVVVKILDQKTLSRVEHGIMCFNASSPEEMERVAMEMLRRRYPGDDMHIFLVAFEDPRP